MKELRDDLHHKSTMFKARERKVKSQQDVEEQGQQ